MLSLRLPIFITWTECIERARFVAEKMGTLTSGEVSLAGKFVVTPSSMTE